VDPEKTSPQQEQPNGAATPPANEQSVSSPAGDSQTGNTAPAGNTPPADAGKTFTQADLDRILGDRLARAKSQWQAEAEEAANKAQMTEAERIQHEAQQAVAAKDETIANLRARLVAAEAKAAASALGVKPERLDYAGKLADLDAAGNDEGEVDRSVVAEAVKAVVADVPELAAATPGTPARSGGDFKNDNGGDGKRVWKTSEITALAKSGGYGEHEADIMAAMREGRIIRDA
jgi:hypothetical protein